jgi:iron complex outermembrane receptor protein
LIAGFDHAAGFGSWTVTGSYAYSKQGVLRGFLVADPVFPQTPAVGIRQSTNLDEIYFDGHLDFTNIPKVTIVAGVDTMYGRGRTHGGDFDYLVAPDGSDAPDVSSIPSAAEAGISDKRWFSGLYGFAAYHPTDRWRLEGGLRLNYTREHRDATVEEFGSPTEGGVASRSETMPSGSLGATFTAWQKDASNVKIFAAYRNTFKPAAIDFGLEAEGEILEPEKGQSYEIGTRGAFFDRRLEYEFEAFRMDLDEIVIAEESPGGTPGLENGGSQRLEGLELELRGRVADRLWLRFAWSIHDPKFRDFTQDFGAGPQQLAGNRLEMAPQSMGSLGAIWAPATGFTAHGELRYTGWRYLNKRNTALAESFVSYSAGIGWRMKNWEIRLDGENLSDERDPVSEAELADAQYYRLPARQIWLSFNWLF